ncbi:hypothetical protein TKK_0019480 [Trichogramma kaykai]|uniref:Bee-milk protein n=1 Tax=Trichogramma kaykai TaxID=54128 RepID=A0ABD2VTU8_9HYME
MCHLHRCYYAALVVVGLFFVVASAKIADDEAKTLINSYNWRYFEYDWSSSRQRVLFIRNGTYDYENMVPIDVDQARDGRIFVTVLAKDGVPASVNTLANKCGTTGGPVLQPYPDWSWHLGSRDCDETIVNVYRVAIDKCNRIWLLDTGKKNGDILCSPKLLVFDLETNELVHRVTIPKRLGMNRQTRRGNLVTPIVYYEDDSCSDPEKAKIFIADNYGNGLLVVQGKEIRRLANQAFEPEYGPAETFSIAGEKFNLSDGVVGLALSPKLPDGSQYLAFRPLASYSMHFIAINELLTKKVNYLSGMNVLPSQGTAPLVFSREGVLFYGLSEEIALGCFNFTDPINFSQSYKIVLRDQERLQFISGLKIVLNEEGEEELLVMSNRMQKVYNDSLDYDETNFRVSRYPVAELVRRCKAEKRD